MCLCNDGYISVITGELGYQVLYGVWLGQRGGVQHIHYSDGSSLARVSRPRQWRRVACDDRATQHATSNDPLTATYDGGVNVMSLAASVDRRLTHLDTNHRVCS